MNMRKNGKFADDAVGRAKLWLPPVEEGKGKENARDGGKVGKRMGGERWTSWTNDDL